MAFRLGFTCGLTAYAVILYWLNIVYNPVRASSLVGQHPALPAAGRLAGPVLRPERPCIARFGELAAIKSAFTLPVAWVAFDFIRSFLLTGFPWAMLGHSQYRTLPLIQIADITGVYGVTLLIVLANVVLYRALRAVSGAGVPYPVKSAV